MLVVFWAVFKVLAPTTFGSPEKLATYMKSALIYAVGGCGLYFICVMGPFDMSVGANIVLSSIIACNASEKFGYAGLIIAPLICGTAWDTDCNAGNVGAFNGIRLGLDGINAGADFRTPVADLMYVVTPRKARAIRWRPWAA